MNYFFLENFSLMFQSIEITPLVKYGRQLENFNSFH